MKSTVSIIIPVYNRATIISKTLDSIQVQTYERWECILVDDGSTDDTLSVLERYKKSDARFKIYKRPESVKKGANGCRNYGFSVATGDYINWFDSDDLMYTNFLEVKLNSFTNTLDAVIHKNVYANYKLNAYRDSKFEYDNGKSLFYNYAMETIELQTCCFMWRRTFLHDKFLFDPKISRYQDNEFHIRMLALPNLNIKILEEVLAVIRSGNGHDTQISSTSKLTKQKLYDVFYYRYQCLQLAKHNGFADEVFNRTLAKKSLWSFYAALKYETRSIKRIKDLKLYYKKLIFIYLNPQMHFKDIIKSHLYLLKIVFSN